MALQIPGTRGPLLELETGRYLGRLEEAILQRPQVRALARNPVMLTCLCVVHWNQGELPEGRARVYRAVIHWLLAARADQRLRTLGLAPDFAERTLAVLALHGMRNAAGKQTLVELTDAVEAVAPAVDRERPDRGPGERRDLAHDWLLFECEGSGVIEEIAGDRLRFWHLTFQEYLAALDLARPAEERDWWPVLREHLDDAQWRETVELFATCLYDLGHADRVDRLLEEVLGLRGAEQDLASEARVAGIVGRLLPSVEVCGYKPAPEIRQAYRKALDRTMEIFSVEGAKKVPVNVRIAAAEALGRGGDPRLAPEVDNFLPGPDGLKLGKYPVTVEEYQRFVDQRGYEERGWWCEEGWARQSEDGWQAPENWDEQLQTPNRPVVYVSWYEATAYCRWLSELCGRTVRLPSEAQWEKTATHPAGTYPWGDEEPDAERCNFNKNVGAVTPVGIYPSGNGVYGHCDFGGNVWEWCSDRLDQLDGQARPLRGGAWWDEARLLRSAYRLRNLAWSRYVGIGFRVSVAPASLDS